jgi:Fe-S cluster biogenesis protein NfuA
LSSIIFVDRERKDMETNEQELHVIQGALETIRAGVESDGGDLELLSFENDIARVQLGGACTGCHMAGQTLGGIRRHLTETLGRPIRVFPAWKD